MKKYFFILLMSQFFFADAQNVGVGTTEPSEKLEVEGIIFTNQGGVKFPDSTIQTTAAHNLIDNPNSLSRGTVVAEFRGVPEGPQIVGTFDQMMPGSIPHIENGLLLEYSSTGAQRPKPDFGGGGGGTSKAVSLPISISLPVDKNLPVFVRVLSEGGVIDNLVLNYIEQKEGGGIYTHTRFLYGNVFITEYEVVQKFVNGKFYHQLDLEMEIRSYQTQTFDDKGVLQVESCWSYENNNDDCPSE